MSQRKDTGLNINPWPKLFDHYINTTKCFLMGKVPGSMSALLTSPPSLLTFEAIEESIIVKINLASYRSLMLENDEKIFFKSTT